MFQWLPSFLKVKYNNLQKLTQLELHTTSPAVLCLFSLTISVTSISLLPQHQQPPAKVLVLTSPSAQNILPPPIHLDHSPFFINFMQKAAQQETNRLSLTHTRVRANTHKHFFLNLQRKGIISAQEVLDILFVKRQFIITDKLNESYVFNQSRYLLMNIVTVFMQLIVQNAKHFIISTVQEKFYKAMMVL